MNEIFRDEQRKRSMKSCYRYLPGSRDKGQRYVVEYRDGMGSPRSYGYTNDLSEAQSWQRKISANALWTDVQVRDRQLPLPE